MDMAGLGDITGLELEKPATRPSIVQLNSKNGYDHVLKGLRSGDGVYLVAEDGTILLEIQWSPITWRLSVTLPKSGRYDIHPGHDIELPK